MEANYFTINIYDTLGSRGFPGGSTVKESFHNLGSIPGLGRSPGEENGNPLQYSWLENSMDCTVHGVTESDMTQWLSLMIQWDVFHIFSDFYLAFLAFVTCGRKNTTPHSKTPIS